jgi:hypothetical protein
MAGASHPARLLRSRWVKVGFSLFLGAAILYFLFKRVDVVSVWAEIRQMTWLELVTIALVAAWNLVTYWALWVAVTPGSATGRR